jgi:hypothetical protein
MGGKTEAAPQPQPQPQGGEQQRGTAPGRGGGANAPGTSGPPSGVDALAGSALELRTATGAIAQLRDRWLPLFEKVRGDGGTPDPMAEYEASAAIRRAEAALRRARGLGADTTAADADLAALGPRLGAFLPTGGSIVSPAVLVSSALPPASKILVTAKIPVAALPADRQATIAAPKVEVEVVVALAGDALHVQIDGQAWTQISVAQLFAQITGGAADVVAQIGGLAKFTADLAARAQQEGRRYRIPLGGVAPNDSYVVIDLERAVRGLGAGNLDGFRPAQAQLLFGKGGGLGGVRVFDDAPSMATAIPGTPRGGWFEIPDDGTMAEALGKPHKAGTVAGGVFYDGGVMRVAIKPTTGAASGIVAHVDVLEILSRLKKLGGKVLDWLAKLAERIKAGAVDFFDVLAGRLRFSLPELGGSWFDFDLKLQLPQLWRGGAGGFRLADLFPTGFHFDLGGLSFGALPKLRFPWLSTKSLGSFSVPWPKLSGLFSGLGSFALPKVPSLDFGLHLAGDFTLGLGLDLSLAWPDLRDLAFGFQVDLRALLGKLGALGDALLRAMRGVGNWVDKWIHLGRDGVLRIYEKGVANGPMVGFHLLRLLDGADAADLVPTEMRWSGSAVALELGEGRTSKAASGPPDKSSPQRPDGTAIARDKIAAPAGLAGALALAPGAKLDVAAYLEADHLIVYSDGKSAVYDGNEAARTSVALKPVYAAVERFVAKKRPAVKAKATLPTIELDVAKSRAMNDGVYVAFQLDTVKGHAGWTLAQLAGATDWTALIPERYGLEVAGLGSVTVNGPLPKLPLLGGMRLPVPAPGLRKNLLAVDDHETAVWAGVHVDKDNASDDLLGLSITSTETARTGASAVVNLSFLLRQLERLGALGKRILDKLVSLFPSAKSGSGDLWERLARAMKKLLSFVDGTLRLPVGGGFIRWNLKLQLPSLSDLDLSRLIPDFDLPFDLLPSLPDLRIQFRDGAGFGLPRWKFSLPSLKLPDLFGGLPKLPSGFTVDVSWLTTRFGVWLELGDLFGDGTPRVFGFDLPIDVLLAKLKRAAAWFGDKMAGLKDLKDHVDVDGDGILRIFDTPGGNRVGFDLKKLFIDGAAPQDLIPVELHVGGKVGSISYGDAHVSAADKKQKAKVLVPKPAGEIAATTLEAVPAWMSEHLSLPGGAKVRASLHLDKTGATAFATADGSDRGLAVHLTTGAVATLVKAASAKLPAFKLPKAPAIGLDFDEKLSRARGMLMIRLAGGATVGWRVERLLAEPAIESLVPDEVTLERGAVSLALARTVDVTALQKQAELATSAWPMAKELGLAGEALEVYTSKDLVPDARIAVVVANPAAKSTQRTGVYVRAGAELVKKIDGRLDKLAREVSGKISAALHRTNRAGQLADGAIKVVPTAAGISAKRGKEGDPGFCYATFDWPRLIELFGGEGDFDVGKLVPQSFRIATATLAAEVKPLDPKDRVSGGAPPGREIKSLHPLLKDTLVGFGLAPTQWIDLAASKIDSVSGDGSMLAATGKIYDVRDGKVIGGKQVQLAIDVQALISQVLPRSRRWQKGTPQVADPKPGGVRVGASIRRNADLRHDGSKTTDDDGIEMALAVKRAAKDSVMSFSLSAGWTFEQLLNLLLHLDRLKADGTMSAAGMLLPKHLTGELVTQKFKLTFGTEGKPLSDAWHANDVYGLREALGLVLDASTIAETRVHLDLPSLWGLANGVVSAIRAKSMYVPIGAAALEVPKPDGGKRFYAMTAALSPWVLLGLLKVNAKYGRYVAAIELGIKFLSDPMGAIENARYLPEVAVDFVRNLPDIAKKAWGDGFFATASKIVLSDTTTKEAAMMGRIRRKLDSVGYKKAGDKKPVGTEKMPEAYLVWLASQDANAMADLARLSDEMEAQGIEPSADVPRELPTRPLTRHEVDLKRAQLAIGYKQIADLDDAVQKATGTAKQLAQAEYDKHLEAMKKQTDDMFQKGATWDPAMGTWGGGKPISGDADTTAYSRTNLTDIPSPDAKQTDEARAIFDDDKQGQGDPATKVTISKDQANYLVRKYAALTTAQLGDLLAGGSAMVGTKSGKEVAIVMLEPERSFVRKLFFVKAKAEGYKLTPGTSAGTAADDVKLVSAQRTKALRDANEAAAAAVAKAGPGGTTPDGQPAEAIDDDLKEDVAPGAGGKDGKSAAGDGKAKSDGDGKAKGDGKDAKAKVDGTPASPSLPWAATDNEMIDPALVPAWTQTLLEWNGTSVVKNDAAAAEIMRSWVATADNTTILDIKVVDRDSTGGPLRRVTIEFTVRAPRFDEATQSYPIRDHVETHEGFYNTRTRQPIWDDEPSELHEKFAAEVAKVGGDYKQLVGRSISLQNVAFEIVGFIKAVDRSQHTEVYVDVRFTRVGDKELWVTNGDLRVQAAVGVKAALKLLVDKPTTKTPGKK